MVDKPVGVIGNAINEAAEARERQEWEAVEVISEHIAAYLNGGPDREVEDIELGRRTGLDLEPIELRWKVARRKVRDREKIKVEQAAAFFKKPAMQPSIEPPKPTIELAKIGPSVEPPTIGPRKVVRWQKIGEGWFYSVDGGRFRRHLGPLPQEVQVKVVQLKVVDQAKPKPEPELEPEEEEEPKKAAVAVANRDVAKTSGAPLGFQHLKNPVGIPASLENAIKAIDKLGAECRYDVFHDRIIVKGHECGVRGDAHENLENVTLKVRQAVLDRFGFDPSPSFTLDALRLRCLDHIFDPVRDYLDGLRWDGVKRLDTWLVKYCRATDTPLNRAIGRKMLVAAVRRVKEPGCKFDYIVVLEGEQGIGKSSVLKILAGEDNFSDNEILGLHKREQQEAIQGVWIYEVAELEGLHKSEVTRVKLFASKTYDSARPAYGRSRVDRPRRCIFVATTNDNTYLRDTTGNRRFWPVCVGVIDLAGVHRDRDQLWAEAVVAEAGGEALVIPEKLWPDVAVQQEARMELDPWEDELSMTLERLIGLAQRTGLRSFMLDGQFGKGADASGNPEWRVSTDYLLTNVLSVPKERQSNNHTKRLAGIMRRLGWIRSEEVLRFGKVVKRGFIKPCE
jgi:predicted P-loop ATPase